MTLDSNSTPSNQDVKNYFDRRFGQETPLLHFIRTQSYEEHLPEIQVPIHVGKIIYLMAKIQKPRQILEIGTLGGYSTAWLAQTLSSEGRLISLEINPHYAEKARAHLNQLKGKNIEIRVGHAVELLSQLATDKEGPFDLILIDADKENIVLYLDWSIRLSRPGTLILIDNLIPKGSKVGYPSNEEAKMIYSFNDYLAQHPSLQIAVFPTLTGSNGRLDGMAIAYVDI